MSELKKYEFPSIILKDKFKYHEDIKEDLLACINKSKDKNWNNVDSFYEDEINKTDWPLADDPDREWIKKYRDNFGNQLGFFAKQLGYKGINLLKLWYQQYENNGTHGWHVHGGNYTGTYYLQLPEDAPTTEFLYTNDLDKSFTIEVKEGDIIFFPCHFIHRSARSQSNSTKTIISWNVDFSSVSEDNVHKYRELTFIK